MGLFDGWGFDPKGLAAAADTFGFGSNGTINPWLGAGLSLLNSATAEDTPGVGGALGNAFGAWNGLQAQRGAFNQQQKVGDFLARALFPAQSGVGMNQVPLAVRRASTPMAMNDVSRLRF